MIAPSDRRLRLLGLAAIILAVVLATAGVPVTSAQGSVLFVTSATGRLPADDPWSPEWDRVPGVDVPLSGQIVAPPMLREPSVPSIRARAMSDDDRIAVLLEWKDQTKDDSVLRADAFADAVAMQLALGEGTSICMGQQAGGLNIWHWKADWAADAEGWRDVQDVNPNMPLDASLPHVVESGTSPPPGPGGFFTGRDAGNLRSAVERPSAVEDLNAIGFGTLTAQPAEGQNVSGVSAHRDGAWRVVLSRKLSTDDPNDARLGHGRAITVAFAAWDGARGDRDGQKSVSSWLTLSFGPAPGLGFVEWWWLALIALALVLAATVLIIGTRQPAVGLGWPLGRHDGGVPEAGAEPAGPDHGTSGG